MSTGRAGDERHAERQTTDNPYFVERELRRHFDGIRIVSELDLSTDGSIFESARDVVLKVAQHGVPDRVMLGLQRRRTGGPARLGVLGGGLVPQPAQQDGDGPGVVADAVIGARDVAQFGTGMPGCQMPRLLVGHLPVVGAVQDQQRTVGELLHGVDCPVLLQLAVPRTR